MKSSVSWLEQTWRWFGPSDPIPLSYIRQAGASGVVTALHHVPNGAVWPVEEILQHKAVVEEAGLTWSVVESVPVHDAIKRATPEAGRYLANYGQTLRNLAQCGIRVVCYNFMPVLDWTRTQTAWRLPNGAEALRFDAVDSAAFDLFILKRAAAERDHSPAMVARASARFESMTQEQKDDLQRTLLLGLPGTVEDMSLAEFQNHLSLYQEIDSPRLRENLSNFLRYVIPIAEEVGSALCIHPDDPPFSIFGLPRVASTEADFEAVLALVDSPANGITFCSGSLGAHPTNNLPSMFRRFGPRVHFLHLRNVKREADGSFFEADHLDGSIDMAAVMEAITEELDARAFRGQKTPLPIRPDHGHRMLGDLGVTFYPGYSAIGRLRGLAELRGLEVGIRHQQRRETQA